MKKVDGHNGSEKIAGEPDDYLYRSAGIRERSGHIPAWLLLVVAGLFVWGVYYLVAYWGPA